MLSRSLFRRLNTNRRELRHFRTSCGRSCVAAVSNARLEPSAGRRVEFTDRLPGEIETLRPTVPRPCRSSTLAKPSLRVTNPISAKQDRGGGQSQRSGAHLRCLRLSHGCCAWPTATGSSSSRWAYGPEGTRPRFGHPLVPGQFSNFSRRASDLNGYDRSRCRFIAIAASASSDSSMTVTPSC